ncbi:MAG: hypothetical protein LUC31_02955 [Coprobacillus sp.]|nr:hypothetical protein [Coprobacillus sp.]
MTLTKMNDDEMRQEVVGEAITLTAVMAILAAAVVAALVCRIATSNSGEVTIPGGWEFQWA